MHSPFKANLKQPSLNNIFPPTHSCPFSPSLIHPSLIHPYLSSIIYLHHTRTIIRSISTVANGNIGFFFCHCGYDRVSIVTPFYSKYILWSIYTKYSTRPSCLSPGSLQCPCIVCSYILTPFLHVYYYPISFSNPPWRYVTFGEKGWMVVIECERVWQ